MHSACTAWMAVQLGSGRLACRAVADKIRHLCPRLFFRLDVEANVAVPQLALAAGGLVVVDGRIDATSVAGRRACVMLLSSMDWAARCLRIPTTSRRYRDQFTINYRALFPDLAGRHYRVDIFEAAVQWTGSRWVNGERFDLSPEAEQAAQALLSAWDAASAALHAWSTGTKREVKGSEGVQLREAMAAFDVAWAAFERKYVTELIDIEAAARGLVLQAVKEDSKLRQMEQEPEGTVTEEELRLQRCALLSAVSRLNSAANLRWKGREDHSAEALERALAVKRNGGLPLPEVAEESGSSDGSGMLAVAGILSDGCVQAFGSVRTYLKEVPNWMDAVHPHLCNNPGLVAIVTTWTEAWELAWRYMQPVSLLQLVGDLVGTIRAASCLEPTLQTMCEECDAELFLVLPRIVMLWFLGDPARRSQLMRRLLPHRFVGEDILAFDDELDIFISSYAYAFSWLVEQQPPSGGPAPCGALKAEQSAWEALMSKAVAGPGGSPTSRSVTRRASDSEDSAPRGARGGLLGATRLPSPPSGDLAGESVVEAFVHELERWSMELQRHGPEEWCQCSAVIVRCLSPDTAPRSPATPQGTGGNPFCV